MESNLAKAKWYYEQGNKNQAIYLITEMLRKDPKDIEAWYTLASIVDEPQKKIFCLEKVLSLDPQHPQAKQDLEKIRAEEFFLQNIQNSTQNQSPKKRKTGLPNVIKETLGELSDIEKKSIYFITGLLIIILLIILVGGIRKKVYEVQAQHAQATATAEFIACTEKYKDEFTRLLSQFFRQQEIVDSTPRIVITEQISQLEKIRTETWNLPEKSCQPRIHSLLMDYMDKSIKADLAFAIDDLNWNSLYVDSIVALARLDDEVSRTLNAGGLLGLFRSKGFFYWEGLEDPNWKKGVTQ